MCNDASDSIRRNRNGGGCVMNYNDSEEHAFLPFDDPYLTPRRCSSALVSLDRYYRGGYIDDGCRNLCFAARSAISTSQRRGSDSYGQDFLRRSRTRLCYSADIFDGGRNNFDGGGGGCECSHSCRHDFRRSEGFRDSRCADDDHFRRGVSSAAIDWSFGGGNFGPGYWRNLTEEAAGRFERRGEDEGNVREEQVATEPRKRKRRLVDDEVTDRRNNDDDDDHVADAENSDQFSSEKKRKKRKKAKVSDDNFRHASDSSEDGRLPAESDEGEASRSKKKKKKSHTQEALDDEFDQAETAKALHRSESDATDASKSKKKKSRKREVLEEAVDPSDFMEGSETGHAEHGKKKKKSKRERVEESETSHAGNGRKKKSKKEKASRDVSDLTGHIDANQDPVEDRKRRKGRERVPEKLINRADFNNADIDDQTDFVGNGKRKIKRKNKKTSKKNSNGDEDSLHTSDVAEDNPGEDHNKKRSKENKGKHRKEPKAPAAVRAFDTEITPESDLSSEKVKKITASNAWPADVGSTSPSSVHVKKHDRRITPNSRKYNHNEPTSLVERESPSNANVSKKSYPKSPPASENYSSHTGNASRGDQISRNGATTSRANASDYKRYNYVSNATNVAKKSSCLYQKSPALYLSYASMSRYMPIVPLKPTNGQEKLIAEQRFAQSVTSNSNNNNYSVNHVNKSKPSNSTSASTGSRKSPESALNDYPSGLKTRATMASNARIAGSSESETIHEHSEIAANAVVKKNHMSSRQLNPITEFSKNVIETRKMIFQINAPESDPDQSCDSAECESVLESNKTAGKQKQKRRSSNDVARTKKENPQSNDLESSSSDCESSDSGSVFMVQMTTKKQAEVITLNESEDENCDVVSVKSVVVKREMFSVKTKRRMVRSKETAKSSSKKPGCITGGKSSAVENVAGAERAVSGTGTGKTGTGTSGDAPTVVKSKVFACDHEGCGFKTPQKHNLNMHVDAVHLKLKKYACDTCEYRAAQKYQLESHMSAMHGWTKCVAKRSLPEVMELDEDRINCAFICAACPFTAPTKAELKRHVYALHEKNKPFHCEHEGCSHKSGSQRDLKRHVRSVHEKDVKPFACHLCHYKSSREWCLTYHMAAHHAPEKPLKCDRCAYRCVIKADLARHVKGVHEKLKDFKCSLCPYETSRSFDYRKHLRMVHGQKIGDK